jgi:hypothetical protein
MTPVKSVNDVGRCAVWCIVVIILLNSFDHADRLTALHSFNTRMRESPDIRNDFIDDISRLLVSFKNFTPSHARRFIDAVKARIVSVFMQIKHKEQLEAERVSRGSRSNRSNRSSRSSKSSKSKKSSSG